VNYRFAVECRALDKLLTRAPSAQWSLYDLCAEIARQPFAEPDLLLSGGDQHAVSVKVRGSILVHYWVDHATRCVNIIDFELIDEDLV
jgi:hypothetical protein